MSADATELRLACALLAGAPPPGDLPAPDAGALVALLRRNRVPTAVLPWRGVLDRDGIGPAVSAYAAGERDRHDRSLDAYSRVAAAWRDADVAAVLIKSPGYYPYTSSNVDVLVAAADEPRAVEVLNALGYSELFPMREPYKRLFRQVVDRPAGFAVHLHTAVAWINRFVPGSEILAGRRGHDRVPALVYPSPDHVFLITTAHWLYEDKELTLRDVHHVAQAVSDGVDWDAVRAHASGSGWRTGLETALALYAQAAAHLGAGLLDGLPPPDPDRAGLARRAPGFASAAAPPFRVPRWVGKGLQLAKTAADPQLSLAAKAREAGLVSWFTVRVKTRAPGGPFVSVALSGPDGAGKSTLARALTDALARDAGLGASRHWIRLGTSRGLEALKAAALGGGGARTAAGPMGAAPGPRDGNRRRLAGRPALGMAWSLVVLVDFLARVWARDARLRLLGGIHVFDRHALDAVVDLVAVYGFAGARWAAALAPRPDVSVVLTQPDGDHLSDLYARHADPEAIVLPARPPLEDVVPAVQRRVIEAFVGDAARGRP